MDYSPPVIEYMRLRNAQSRPRLRFEVADCTALSLAPSFYDLVLDKGLLDAIVCAPDAQTGVSRMMDAIGVGMAAGGAYVLVSHAPPAKLLPWVSPDARGWRVETWVMPKPGMGGGQPAALYTPQDDASNTLHFVYVFRRSLEVPLGVLSLG